MSKKTYWSQVILAAVMVAAAGVAIALEETVTIEVIQTDGEEVTLKLDDTTEVLSVGDLADGEERTFYSGEHEVVVKREGDMLLVTLDGDEIGANCTGEGHKALVWVSEDGEEMQLGDGEHQVFVVKTVVEGDGEPCAGAQRFHYTIGDESKVEVGEGGPNVLMFRAEHDNKVHYRCEESGEELVVDKDLAISDTYVSPVSGCLMQKVDVAERLQHVIKVVREVETETEED